MLAISLAASGAATAQDESKPKFSEKQLAQQQRMIDCSADAKQKQLKGDARKALMKTCLSGGQIDVTVGDEVASAPETKRERHAAQKEKMKTCEFEAKAQGLEGDAHQQFMSECLAK